MPWQKYTVTSLLTGRDSCVYCIRYCNVSSYSLLFESSICGHTVNTHIRMYFCVLTGLHMYLQRLTENNMFVLSWFTASGSGMGSVCLMVPSLSPTHAHTKNNMNKIHPPFTYISRYTIHGLSSPQTEYTQVELKYTHTTLSMHAYMHVRMHVTLVQCMHT